MDIIVQNELGFNIDIEKLSQKLQISHGTEDYDAFEEYVNQAKMIAKPKAIYSNASIDNVKNNCVAIDGKMFEGSILFTKFSGIFRVFPYIITSGHELEEWSKGISDFLAVYWADMIKQAVLTSVIKAVRTKIKKTYDIKKLWSVNPGSLKEWPIHEQKKLFSLFGDVKDLIGVELTESNLMIPTKTISGIYFESEKEFENCQLCPRDNCSGRRAPYDENLHNRMV